MVTAGLTVLDENSLCLPCYSCMEPVRLLKPGHRSSREDAVGGLCKLCAHELNVALLEREECADCRLVGGDWKVCDLHKSLEEEELVASRMERIMRNGEKVGGHDS